MCWPLLLYGVLATGVTAPVTVMPISTGVKSGRNVMHATPPRWRKDRLMPGQKNNADKVKLMRSENKSASSLLACRLMPIVPVLLLVGCTTGPTNSPGNWQTVNAPAVPELPAEARQKPAAPYCSPTCSAALMIERGNWQKMLMKQEPED
ncbi:hypothetical protein A3N46_08385 [Enterobacter asburiae]|nr:hypothetical protein A3N46_08385 [Enterobacter asburiae]